MKKLDETTDENFAGVKGEMNIANDFQEDIVYKIEYGIDNNRMEEKLVRPKQSTDVTVSYGCDQCKYSTSYKTALTRHIKTVHEKIRNLECEFCDHRFSQKGHLSVHLSSKHGKD